MSNQVQYVQSRIVTQNNSSLVSAINLNPNKLSTYQTSAQYQQQFSQPAQLTHLVASNNVKTNQSHHGNRILGGGASTHKLSRPASNKTITTNQNPSILQSQEQTNHQSSLNKRSSSVTRGGIKVVSRNSSVERKSQTSVQKSITSKDLNLNNPYPGNQQKPSGIAICGMNCTTRNPFTQNQQTNQMTVIPNLGSLQTLNSGIISSHTHYSDRERLESHRNPSLQKYSHKNFYQNISERTHLEPTHCNGFQKNNSELMKENMSINSNNQNVEKVYKQVREMMEKEIMVAKKMYQKKCLDEMECMNSYFKSQIETLQKVLGQNLTVIQEQEGKIAKLEDKILKKEAKTQKYSQRFEYLIKYIDKSNKFSLQRIDEVERKFILLLSEFQSFHISPSQSDAIENKITYLQEVFSTLVVNTIIKYRSIEYDIKEEVNKMMKKYDFYEEKIYEMDLMKHLGKENQIQNYRLIQSIEGIKEKIVILESKANMKSEMRDFSGNSSDLGSGSNTERTMNINKMEQLKRIVGSMEYKLGNLEQECTESSLKIYKLEGAKSQLQSKVLSLENQINTTKKDLIKIRAQRDELLREREWSQKEFVKQRESHEKTLNKLQEDHQKLKLEIQNHQKRAQNQHDESQFQDSPQKRPQTLEIRELKREIQRLQEIIDQYENKMEHLHDAIHRVQAEKALLLANEKNNSKNLQDQIIFAKETELYNMRKQLDQKCHQLDSKNRDLERAVENVNEALREKQELQEALETTEQIFDQQISKFKETIKLLQEENSQLLTQINELRQGQTILGNSSASSKSIPQSYNYANMGMTTSSNKVVLAKSPKKEMCETVTMGWFKKATSKKEEQAKKSPSNFAKAGQTYDQFSSPINQYYFQGNKKVQYPSKHAQPEQKDDFFYHSSAQNNINSLTSRSSNHTSRVSENTLQQRSSFDETSNIQSYPQVTPYFHSYSNTSTSYQQNVIKNTTSNRSKIQGQRVGRKSEVYSSPINKFQQFSSKFQSQSHNNEEEQEQQTYIF